MDTSSSLNPANGVRSSNAVTEVLLMIALLLSYIWIWQGSFAGDFLLCYGLYLLIGLSSHRRRGETARDIGIRFDNLPRALIQAAIFVGPLILLPPVVGLKLGTINLSGNWAMILVGRFVWGTAQQYGLVCFFYRRLGEVLPGEGRPMVAAASLFALFHLPNPFLSAVTLGAGVVACWLYRRVPNLFALGVAHAVLSISISRCLPLDVTYGLRVGPGFWQVFEKVGGGMFG